MSNKQPVKSNPTSGVIKGLIEVDGDKSISHRAVLFNAIAVGKAEILNILEGEDVIDTIKCLEACGVKIQKIDNKYIIYGVGLNGLQKPSKDLYFGNSGTSVRLFMGVLAGQLFKARLTGDQSLSKRDMKRVVDPLSTMGVEFDYDGTLVESKVGNIKKTSEKITLPIEIKGQDNLIPIEYRLPMASAQVKSAILLAGLNCNATTTVIEPEKTRDHTENMLKTMGADLKISGHRISIKGGVQLKAMDIEVCGDPSSAAFLVAAAILTKGSEITIKNVYINKTRIGFYEALQKIGANVKITESFTKYGEPVGDITAKYSPNMKAIDLPSSINPSMIDEFPIFCVISCFTNGRMKMNDLKELTAKESNRILAIANGLSSCGVSLTYNDQDHSLIIYGDGINKVLKPENSVIQTQMDHRIAMSFIIAGLKSEEGIKIDDSSMIKTSFPKFEELFKKIGGNLTYL